MKAELQAPLQDLRAALTHAAGPARALSEPVRLGFVTPAAAGPFMVDIVREFRQRHPESTVEEIDVGLNQDPLACLHRKEIDLLAIRLPINRDGLTVGPVVSSENRVLAVCIDHPLAEYNAVSWDAVAEYLVAAVPAFPIEAYRHLVPEYSPSGIAIRRGPEVRSFAELLLRVARGEVVHPTVASLSLYHRHPRVTTVPLLDPSPSRSGLIWSTRDIHTAAAAFVDCARQILAESRLEPVSGGDR
ncbi:LysR substrate-binding domain-containing protein [Nocardia sp. NPDC019395]|uniref:LysR substrate-binding domain-containing protein n=1 Tax=Nocardia sp. NPDC019395 TaxID=3154686 RepID=UPI00340BB29A